MSYKKSPDFKIQKYMDPRDNYSFDSFSSDASEKRKVANMIGGSEF